MTMLHQVAKSGDVVELRRQVAWGECGRAG
jgi:hypothetical protein